MTWLQSQSKQIYFTWPSTTFIWGRHIIPYFKAASSKLPYILYTAAICHHQWFLVNSTWTTACSLKPKTNRTMINQKTWHSLDIFLSFHNAKAYPDAAVTLPIICWMSLYIHSIIGGSCHKHHFCCNRCFVATNMCLSWQNTSFVVTKACLSQQT